MRIRKGLTGSSAADSQLATARSQLRFQSAAFSSSLQTASHHKPFGIKTKIREQNKKKKEKRKKEIKENMKTKREKKMDNFESSVGMAHRKLSLERPYSVPLWCSLKKTRGSRREHWRHRIVPQTALPTANTAPH